MKKAGLDRDNDTSSFCRGQLSVQDQRQFYTPIAIVTWFLILSIKLKCFLKDFHGLCSTPGNETPPNTEPPSLVQCHICEPLSEPEAWRSCVRKSLSVTVNTENPHGSIIHHQSTYINDRRSWNASSSFSWLHRYGVNKSQDSGDNSWGDVNRLWQKQSEPGGRSDTSREPEQWCLWFSSCPSHYTWRLSIWVVQDEVD